MAKEKTKPVFKCGDYEYNENEYYKTITISQMLDTLIATGQLIIFCPEVKTIFSGNEDITAVLNGSAFQIMVREKAYKKAVKANKKIEGDQDHG